MMQGFSASLIGCSAFMVSASKARLSLEQFLDFRSSVGMPLMGYMGPINSMEEVLEPINF